MFFTFQGKREVFGLSKKYVSWSHHGEWDPNAPVTPMGQWAFFVDFLKIFESFLPQVLESPLSYTSNNVPQPVDVLGTLLLSILPGHWRYSPISTLRCDYVNPELLGMSMIGSPDFARRAFSKTCTDACRD